MRFFVSSYADNDSGITFVVYITNELYEDRVVLLDSLRDYFGPWMFLGIREYDKKQFLQQFTDYIPARVLNHIESNPAVFTYKAEIHIK